MKNNYMSIIFSSVFFILFIHNVHARVISRQFIKAKYEEKKK